MKQGLLFRWMFLKETIWFWLSLYHGNYLFHFNMPTYQHRTTYLLLKEHRKYFNLASNSLCFWESFEYCFKIINVLPKSKIWSQRFHFLFSRSKTKKIHFQTSSFQDFRVEIWPEISLNRISLKNGFKVIERTCYFLNIFRNYLLS